MIRRTVTIINDSGLHVRPAAVLVKAAETCSSKIEIIYKHNIINAKSLLNILSVSIAKGEEVELCCTGPDEEADMEKIVEAMKHLEDQRVRVKQSFEAALFLFAVYLFIKKAGEEPERRIVEADNAIDMIGSFAVIPGAAVHQLQNCSRQEFYRIDAEHIDKPPGDGVKSFQMPGKGCDEGCHSVYGKHMKRGCACQFWIMTQKGMKTGPENFNAPAVHTAADKSGFHGDLLGNRFTIQYFTIGQKYSWRDQFFLWQATEKKMVFFEETLYNLLEIWKIYAIIQLNK